MKLKTLPEEEITWPADMQSPSSKPRKSQMKNARQNLEVHSLFLSKDLQLTSNLEIQKAISFEFQGLLFNFTQPTWAARAVMRFTKNIWSPRQPVNTAGTHFIRHSPGQWAKPTFGKNRPWKLIHDLPIAWPPPLLPHLMASSSFLHLSWPFSYQFCVRIFKLLRI